jgi:HlyD family secretion protein
LLQSPDELDQLLVAVDRESCLIVLTLAALCVVGIMWAVFGRIPVTVDRYEVLANPGNVKAVPLPVRGQVTSVEARIGQHVARRQLLAPLDQPALRKELEQPHAKKENRSAALNATAAMDQQ